MSDERKFLHDISNPLGTVFFLVDALIEDVKSGALSTPKTVEQLQLVSQTLDKMKNMVETRRAEIKARQQS